MDVSKVRALLQQALTELETSVPAPTIGIDTPDAFDHALAIAKPGDTIRVSAALVYPKPLVLSKPVLLLGDPGVFRMTVDQPLAQFNGGLTVPANGVTVSGVQIRHSNPLTDIVTVAGARAFLDRLRILGDPVHGAKRGIAANGNGACVIQRCYVEDCFQASPGNDSQAICAWDMAPGLKIFDNYLSAGSETILLGGADASSAERMPSDIDIIGNTLTARPEWMGQPIGVKTRLEVKAARGVRISSNHVSQCWKQGQGGYLLSLTVRNQGGKAPWSTIADVTVHGNTFAHGAAAVNVLAQDDNAPSIPMARISVSFNEFLDIDPVAYGGGSARLVQLAGGPTDFSLEENHFDGTHSTSVLYFTGKTKAKGLVVRANTWPKTKYGIFGDGAMVGKAWEQYVESGELSGNVEIAPTA